MAGPRARFQGRNRGQLGKRGGKGKEALKKVAGEAGGGDGNRDQQKTQHNTGVGRKRDQ